MKAIAADQVAATSNRRIPIKKNKNRSPGFFCILVSALQSCDATH